MWSAEEILHYWFGPLDQDNLPDQFYRERWFKGDKKFDREIRRRFMSTVVFAAEEGLEGWNAVPEGSLCLILLLDQFSRHIFRNTSMAFDYDREARKTCRDGLDRNFDRSLLPIQRVFFYMPLKHSEKLEDQRQSVALHHQLLSECKGREKDVISGFTHVAERNHTIVQRFNRFPQRNKALGRASRPEEIAFLDEQSNIFRA